MQESLLESNDLRIRLPHSWFIWAEAYAKKANYSIEDVIILGLGKLKLSQDASLQRAKAPKKTHYRLEAFLTAYEAKRGFKYVVGDYNAHCGAAARTVSKVTDEQWAGIVDLYLSSQESRVKQAGYPFHWLIHDLNRWFRESNSEKSVGWAQKLKDIMKGKV